MSDGSSGEQGRVAGPALRERPDGCRRFTTMTDLTAQGFTDRSFGYLEGLAANNDRDWVHARSDLFDEAVDRPFLEVLAALSDRLSDAEVPLKGGPKTCFRMNRDVRFSPDKSSYRTERAALLTPDGTKDEDGPLLDLQFAADGGMAFCGWHDLTAGELAPMRRRILDRADAFDDVLAGLDAAGVALDRGDALKTMPRGFEHASGHRHADILRLTTLGARLDVPKVAWTSGDVVDRVADLARATMPLIAHLR